MSPARSAVRPPVAQPAAGQRWCGDWVSERLDVRLSTTSAQVGVPLTDLVGLALRRNPRRAHLLVSRVLGKHVPTDPRVVHGAGLLLGLLVRRALSGAPSGAADGGDEILLELGTRLRGALSRPGAEGAAARFAAAVRAALSLPVTGAFSLVPPAGDPVPAVVLGYAETATGLGHCVAEALGHADYLHSTRREGTGVAPFGAFAEEHSHATEHLLLPRSPQLLVNDRPLVLVDDELSTGRTALNTIAELHRLAPRERYVIASLVDVRPAADRLRVAQAARDLGASIEVVSLAAGEIELPDDVLTRAARLLAAPAEEPGADRAARRRPVTSPPAPHVVPARVTSNWPPELAATARHGVGRDDAAGLDAVLPTVAATLAAAVLPFLTRPQPGARATGSHGRGPGPGPVRRLLVLGVEELMYVPLRIAAVLADDLEAHGVEVRFSTTTRSPVLAVDDPGYAIRAAISFPAHDTAHDTADHTADHTARAGASRPEPPAAGVRYLYNLAADRDGEGVDAVLLVLDEAADTPALHAPGGLLDRLRSVTDVALVAVVGETA